MLVIQRLVITNKLQLLCCASLGDSAENVAGNKEKARADSPTFPTAYLTNAAPSEAAFDISRRLLKSKKVTNHVKLRSKVKVLNFRRIGYRDWTGNNSCEPKLCHDGSHGTRMLRYNDISKSLCVTSLNVNSS